MADNAPESMNPTNLASSHNPPVLLDGFRLILQFLMEHEADQLCGAPLQARARGRTNYRSGYYTRRLVTGIGTTTLRVPHLRYFHPRASILKRARRLSHEILETLARVHATGAARNDSIALIKNLWTIHLPDDLLAELAEKLISVIEQWRAGKSAQDASKPRRACSTGSPTPKASTPACPSMKW